MSPASDTYEIISTTELNWTFFRRCKLRRGCDLDVSETLHVLDDRLFDYVETECSDNDAAGDYLAYCVRISDLIRAFEDDVFELDREKFDGEKREEIESVDVGGHSDDDEADDECGYPSQVAWLLDFLSIV